MRRTTLLLSLATGATAAVAVPTLLLATPGSAAPAAASAASVATAPTPKPSPSTPGNGQQCGYPSNRTPQVTLSASPTTVKQGKPVSLTGFVQKNRCALSGVGVKLYAAKTQTGSYTAVATTSTRADGSYSFTQKPTDTTYYRVGFVGNKTYDAALSPVVKVTVTK